MLPMAGYCASKAAAYSYTQATRAALAGKGIAVHGAFPGGVDTDMLAGVDAPKADPTAVAARILDGIEHDVADIIPDDFSAAMYKIWRSDPKQLEAQFAS
jgi:short-subunit dehydrogenase